MPLHSDEEEKEERELKVRRRVEDIYSSRRRGHLCCLLFCLTRRLVALVLWVNAQSQMSHSKSSPDVGHQRAGSDSAKTYSNKSIEFQATVSCDSNTTYP